MVGLNNMAGRTVMTGRDSRRRKRKDEQRRAGKIRGIQNISRGSKVKNRHMRAGRGGN